MTWAAVPSHGTLRAMLCLSYGTVCDSTPKLCHAPCAPSPNLWHDLGQQSEVMARSVPCFTKVMARSATAPQSYATLRVLPHQTYGTVSGSSPKSWHAPCHALPKLWHGLRQHPKVMPRSVCSLTKLMARSRAAVRSHGTLRAMLCQSYGTVCDSTQKLCHAPCAPSPNLWHGLGQQSEVMARSVPCFAKVMPRSATAPQSYATLRVLPHQTYGTISGSSPKSWHAPCHALPKLWHGLRQHPKVMPRSVCSLTKLMA